MRQICDYWIVRKCRLHVPMLYQNEGIYRYQKGINWRALVTLVVVVPINLPGLIHAINAKVHIGNLAYFCEQLNKELMNFTLTASASS